MENITFVKTQKEDLILQALQKVNEGFVPADVFEYIYANFHKLIPYDRIGISLISKDNIGLKATAFWLKSESTNVQLKAGYSAYLAGTSLGSVLESKKPRIINNLEEYAKKNPHSEATQLILAEGVRSSLTCPLIHLRKPIGFIFFSSQKYQTYQDLHVEIFQSIANIVATMIEKSRIYEKCAELNSLKTRFIGIAAHDLRNPLQVIKGNLSLIQEEWLGPINEEQKNTLSLVQKQTDQMLDIIKTFLDVSVIESGHLDLHKEKQDFSTFLQSCFTANHLLAKAKNIELILDDKTGNLSLSFDSARINQVIFNLLSNALKFSKSETTIHILAQKKEKTVEVSIQDEGPGIAEKDIDHLFEFFKKGEAKPTGKESSTGFGLAICKKIIDEHGGTITVKNNPTKGATFSFTLPL